MYAHLYIVKKKNENKLNITMIISFIIFFFVILIQSI